MLCEKCNKNMANVYLKNNINGNITENYLCSSCAGTLYSQNHNYAQLADLFGGGFDSDIFSMLNFNKTSPSALSFTETERKICPVCGSSFTDITKSGKAGCGSCYETFKNELAPNVIRIHGTANHTGKIPKNRSAQISAKRKIEQLKVKLKKAIEAQNFEEAAVIRDDIAKVNQEIQGA